MRPAEVRDAPRPDDGPDVREAVNAWIRKSGEFDAVLDFDAALRDPRLLPEYDSGDHLHPNARAGHRAMGEAIDVRLFDGPA